MAVSAVIPGRPVKLMFKIPVAVFVNPPVPVKAVVAVNVPLFVSVIPLTVTLGIKKVPVKAWSLVSNVCTPLPAVNVALFVIPPRKVTVKSGDVAEVIFRIDVMVATVEVAVVLDGQCRTALFREDTKG